jgi:glycosyltransferase involved in cell wall biosynthesis
MRAFWPDEMVSAGRLKPGSLVYRLLKRAEVLLLKRAAAVVSLTEAAVAHLSAVDGLGPDRIRYVVIPTCVDTRRFRPRPGRAEAPPRLFATTGTVIGGWFLLDRLFDFWVAALARFPEIRFRIVSRDPVAAIRTAAAAWPDVLKRLEIVSRSPSEMPQEVAAFDVAAMFFMANFSKLGSCPTRMGEMLACGCPVVVNDSVGDVGEIIRRYRVGVVVREGSDAAMQHAACELALLLRDPDLSPRCRTAAEEWFSLRRGVERYDRLYREVCEGEVTACGKETW